MGTSFGELISSARQEKQRSLRDLAAELDLSASYLNDIEHNRRVPAESNVVAIAGALDLDADDLLAAAGRVGADAEVYLKVEPAAGVLLRTAATASMSNEELQELIRNAHRIIGKRSLPQT
ncbi:MAG: hypothetical protein JWQ39_613 [Glaciihabitans sp.]|nr:hypothetical protein [Glaciihabitans sp.]